MESINEIEGIYMKLRFISSALAAALFAATGSYAAVVDGGTIHFEGELVNAACSVNTDWQTRLSHSVNIVPIFSMLLVIPLH
ncbi:hypothetical protein HMPREF1591_03021 [Escherichia coli 113303]|nr:hypothetical protein HMPREF1591_03021 [Escherichia coli 113303]